MTTVTRVTNHPGRVFMGVLITEPTGRFIRVHFNAPTLSFDSGPRLVGSAAEAEACILKWRREYREALPKAAFPAPSEGSLAEDMVQS